MNEVVAAFPHRDLHVVLDNLNIHTNLAARRALLTITHDVHVARVPAETMLNGEVPDGRASFSMPSAPFWITAIL